jgi:hypothetical protein
MTNINQFTEKGGRYLRENSTSYNHADAEHGAYGFDGFEYISDTEAHTPPAGQVFFALQFIDASVVLSLAGAGVTGNAIGGASFPAGFTLYGRFTSVQLTSGRCVAQKVAYTTITL